MSRYRIGVRHVRRRLVVRVRVGQVFQDLVLPAQVVANPLAEMTLGLHRLATPVLLSACVKSSSGAIVVWNSSQGICLRLIGSVKIVESVKKS